MSREEIQAFCEAYEVYKLFPEDLQNKIPNDFVETMKDCSKNNLGVKINCIDDIKSKKLSREGIKKIAYMCLFIK